MYRRLFSINAVFFILYQTCESHLEDKRDLIRVNKCCEPHEILVDLRCTDVNETNSDVWSPIFTGFNGQTNIQVPGFWFAVGVPKCSQKQMWPIYYYPNSQDRLALLPDGTLRHFIQNSDIDESEAFDPDNTERAKEHLMVHDYAQGKYCMDKAIATRGMSIPSEYALVCLPDRESHWTDTEFLLRKIVNPICHGISIAILLTVAIVYFVLPSLRDLVGNIVTTMTCCLIVGQIANLMRIFTEFYNHYNFLILDVLVQVSVMTVFFWLTSLGYFVWKTFRSRNVFLRITDGKKYCWYSFYVWGATIAMASLGIFAHIFLDIDVPKNPDNDLESIGLLGLTVFFIANTISIALSIYFYISTYNYLSNRLNASYGRIHHKLKSNFTMFALLLIVLTLSWVLALISMIEYEGMFYINLIISGIQAPLVLYICVLRQKHVTYLLQKSCCSKQPMTGSDWGDEMTYINTAH